MRSKYLRNEFIVVKPRALGSVGYRKSAATGGKFLVPTASEEPGLAAGMCLLSAVLVKTPYLKSLSLRHCIKSDWFTFSFLKERERKKKKDIEFRDYVAFSSAANSNKGKNLSSSSLS